MTGSRAVPAPQSRTSVSQHDLTASGRVRYPRAATGQTAPKNRERVRVLAEIAARYHELVAPLNGPDHVRGDGGSLPLPPATYTASVREFERLLRLMRNQGRQLAYRGEPVCRLRWHVLAWFVDAVRVIDHHNVYVVRHGKKRLVLRPDGKPETRPVLAHRRHPEAREEKAVWGLEWMADRWGLETEPMLPRELVAA